LGLNLPPRPLQFRKCCVADKATNNTPSLDLSSPGEQEHLLVCREKRDETPIHVSAFLPENIQGIVLMTNALSIFRRNQKVLLVVLGVLVIFVFTVGSILLEYMNRAGGGGDAQAEIEADEATVVVWKNGEVSQGELRNMFRKHARTMAFLSGIQAKAKENDPKAEPKTNVRLQQAQSQEQLFVFHIMAEKAKEAGFIVTDKAIQDYLQQLTDEQLTQSDYREVMKATLGDSMDEGQLYDQLRREILAAQYGSMAAGDSVPPTPAQAFELTSRIERRATADIVAVSVEEYVSLVKNKPTDAELMELYSKYKVRYPIEQSRTPGFQRPQKLAFGYIKADIDQLNEIAKAAVPEAAVRKKYEENKALGVYLIEDAPEDKPEDKPEDGDPQSSLRSDVDTQFVSLADDAPSDSEPEAPQDGDPAPAPPTEAPAGKHKSFEEVEDSIRELLVKGEAGNEDSIEKTIADVFGKARASVRRHSTRLIRDPEMTESLEMSKYEQPGFTLGHVKLSNYLEVAKTELGKAVSPYTQTNFVRQAYFQTEPSLYRSDSIQHWDFQNGGSQAQYFYWITEIEEAYIPTFEQAKEDVVEAWKKEEARKLAYNAARDMVAEARKTDSLKSAFPEKVKSTGSFSCMRQRNARFGEQVPSLNTQIDNVELAGLDFIEMASALELNEIGVAWNDNQSIAYVIQIVAEESSEEQRIADFLDSQSQGDDTPLRIKQGYEIQRYQAEWVEELLDDMEVRWEQDPSARS